MKTLFALIKKEFLETARTGKLFIIVIMFILLGIMNPAIAKLLPWMMKIFADTMAESGLIISDIQVDAMTSWTQFFKNIPIALIAFTLLYSDIFTKEYKSGTLLLILSKGLPRYKIVLAKTILLISLWSFGYWFCFAITYGYNAYFWDNSVANSLFAAAAVWWLFGIWATGLIVLFSSLLKNNTGVLLCIGATVAAAYLLSIIPKEQTYSPVLLTNTNSLLIGAVQMGEYMKAIIATAALCIVCVAVSIPLINKKQL